jgi:CheY-like chemotaxis protein
MIAHQTDLAPVVLIVDDEPMLLGLMARTLREHGFAVLAAPHGAAALSQLEALGRPAELLVTDLQMPGLSGDVLAERALTRGLARHVLFISGYDRERRAAGRPGPLLTKPFSPAVFYDAVDSLMHFRVHSEPDTPVQAPGSC